MRRVQEIIHVVPEKREEYLNHKLNPTLEIQQMYWMHGVRNQFYFMLNDLILMTFEYVGNNFYEDMSSLSNYLREDGYFVETRRRDVPEEDLATTNWWAPLKSLGGIITTNPMPDDEKDELDLQEQYREMMSGYMDHTAPVDHDIAYDEEDWDIPSIFE